MHYTNRMALNVLAIGAHPDDVEIGCGGTLLRHALAGHNVILLVITQGEAGPGDVDDRVAEQEAAARVLGVKEVIWGHLPDGRVSNHELSLVHVIEQVISQHGIDVVYTHGPGDSHQDHRAVAQATEGAARHAGQVLCYNSPSSVGFLPTVFVDITDNVERKVAALECHSSQVNNSRMASTDLVRMQAGYMGFQARVPAAEGFVPHRLLLPISGPVSPEPVLTHTHQGGGSVLDRRLPQ